MMLLVDLGGTRLRTALRRGGALVSLTQDVLAADADPVPVLRAALARAGQPVSEVRLAVAGPIVGGGVTLTNRAVRLDEGALRRELGVSGARLVNDLEAAAWGVGACPQLRTPLDGSRAAPMGDAPVLVVGVGTGLGSALWWPAVGRALPAEGGHHSAAGFGARSDAVIAWLRDRLGHVSYERVASGSGLRWLDEALAALDGEPAPQREPAEVAAGADARAREAVGLMLRFLGACAGNLALATGAWGGVVFVGGVLPRLGATGHADLAALHAAFMAKGRFETRLAAVPVSLVADDTIGLRGLAAMP